jgi:uncharacterized protein
MKSYEFRDPVHGFIQLNEWERDIVNHPAFQRLRRIKQLAWTDMVYPGATHTRFEHSLGVMHVASQIFDSLVDKHSDLFRELQYADTGRARQLVRLAALLHDIGHAPFSHAAEELFPINSKTNRIYSHEEYSSAIVQHCMPDLFSHPLNRNSYNITVQDIVDFFSATPSTKGTLALREIVSGQMDADRMDYMLRDSHHAGVSYGRFDLARIVATIRFVKRPETEEYSLGISEDGVHAAEGLLIARFMMFTQIYFHKTRVIFDYHLVEAMKEILKANGGCFPTPDAVGITEYLKWDDWRVLGNIPSVQSAHRHALEDRKHFRLFHETPEVPTPSDTKLLKAVVAEVTAAGIAVAEREASKNWYKFDSPGNEIFIEASSGMAEGRSIPLSERSSIVKGLSPVRQTRLYVPIELRNKATKIAGEIRGRGDIL